MPSPKYSKLTKTTQSSFNCFFIPIHYIGIIRIKKYFGKVKMDGTKIKDSKT